MRKIKCWKCGEEVYAAGEAALCPTCRVLLAASSTVRTRICRACGASFQGGPRAWYCPDCRAERAKAANRASKARARAGKTRKLGSTDICAVCGKPYTVDGPNQRYCPDCAQDAVRQIDRAQSRAWAEEHREDFLARKREQAHGRKVCVVCGSQFYTGTTTVTCSPACAEVLRAYRQAMADHKRRGSPAPTIDAVQARIARKSGVPGVSRSRNGKRWVAQCGGKYLGTFDSISEAEHAIKKIKEGIK